MNNNKKNKKHINVLVEDCLASVMAGSCDSTTEKQHAPPSPIHKDWADEDPSTAYLMESILIYMKKMNIMNKKNKKHINALVEDCLASVMAGSSPRLRADPNSGLRPGGQIDDLSVRLTVTSCDGTTEKQHVLPSPNHKDWADEDFVPLLTEHFRESVLECLNEQGFTEEL
jgi:hypothetical protein